MEIWISDIEYLDLSRVLDFELWMSEQIYSCVKKIKEKKEARMKVQDVKANYSWQIFTSSRSKVKQHFVGRTYCLCSIHKQSLIWDKKRFYVISFLWISNMQKPKPIHQLGVKSMWLDMIETFWRVTNGMGLFASMSNNLLDIKRSFFSNVQHFTYDPMDNFRQVLATVFLQSMTNPGFLVGCNRSCVCTWKQQLSMIKWGHCGNVISPDLFAWNFRYFLYLSELTFCPSCIKLTQHKH